MLRGRTRSSPSDPVVHIRGEIIAEQQRRCSARPETPVGELHFASLDKMRGRGLVRVVGHWHTLLRRFIRGFTDLDTVVDQGGGIAPQ